MSQASMGHKEGTFLTSTHLGIGLECMPGGDLFRYCESRPDISEMRVRSYMQQVFAAIHFMHKKGIVDREINLDNLLLDKSRKVVKVAACCWDPLSPPKCNIGRPNYIAPELMRKGGGGSYDGLNIWSCGVCLYVMRYRKYPFSSPDDPTGLDGYRRVMKRSLEGDFTLPDNHGVSEECKDLIRRCLQPDPAHRITIAEILNHPWFPPQYASQVNF